MIEGLYVVYDAKAEASGSPLALVSKAAAIRGFSDAVADGKSDFAKHPEDYSLWYIGDWDKSTMALKPAKTPVQVITALECLRAPHVKAVDAA